MNIKKILINQNDEKKWILILFSYVFKFLTKNNIGILVNNKIYNIYVN